MSKVKICGITNLEDARHAVACGADMLGFNFYAKSSRYVTPELARSIAMELPERVWKVGVFVNMESYRVAECVDLIGLDTVQIHGDEDVDYLCELRKETDARIIKAFRIGPNNLPCEVAEPNADLILVDTYSNDGEYGGSGKFFDWSLVTTLGNIILAGGLAPENVSEAIRIVRPFAVDVASGVESSPGKKDAAKVSAFIKTAKEAI